MKLQWGIPAFAIATALLLATTPFITAEQTARDEGGATRARVGTASLSGVLTTSSDDAKPVRRATIAATGAAIGNGRMTITDDAGHFSFTGLPAGTYTLAASKPTFVTTYYGSHRPGRGPGVAIALADNQQRSDLHLTITPGAVIAGTIFDQHGRPLPGGAVSILEVRGTGADRTLVPVKRVDADVRGMYRAFGLAPATYVVAATTLFNFSGASVPTAAEFAAALQGPPGRETTAAPTQQRTVGYVPVFFPNSLNPAGATTMDLASGQERSGVDITLQLVPTARLNGSVVDPSGRPPQGLQLSVLTSELQWGFPARPGVMGSIRFDGVVSTKNGVFSSRALPPGHYTFFARASETAGDAASTDLDVGRSASAAKGPITLWAIADLDVDGRDIPDFVIRLQPAMRVSGRVTFAGTRLAPPSDLSKIQVRLVPSVTNGANIGVAPVQANADGTFTFRGVPPGQYRIAASVLGAGNDGWTMQSASLDQNDVIDVPFSVGPGASIANITVTFGDLAATLSGTLVDPLGRPAPEYVIVVFSTDRRWWTPQSRRVRQLHPTSDGRYVVAGLPPGEDDVGTITGIEPGDIDDAAFLDQVSQASMRLTLAPGEKKMQPLKLGGS